MSTSDSFFINHPHLVQLLLALCIVVAILINIYNLRRPDPPRSRLYPGTKWHRRGVSVMTAITERTEGIRSGQQTPRPLLQQGSDDEDEAARDALEQATV